MRRFLGLCLLLAAAWTFVFQAAVLADHGESGEGDKQGVRLLDAGKLEKFVDELPDMPVLRGYGVAEGGTLVAGELTVGMYDTTWVRMSAAHTEVFYCFAFPSSSSSGSYATTWRRAVTRAIVWRGVFRCLELSFLRRCSAMQSHSANIETLHACMLGQKAMHAQLHSCVNVVAILPMHALVTAKF
jgi:hypothetical protein